MVRYEYPSIWETEEVHAHLVDITTDDGAMSCDGASCPETAAPTACPAAPADPDAGAPRATVKQYAAVVGEEVAYNLEALARVRAGGDTQALAPNGPGDP